MSARQPKRALLVIDVQNEYVSGNLRIEFPSIQSSLERIGAAMDAAHAAGIPIVVVQHLAPADSPLFARGSRQAELHEVVASRPYQHKVEKQLASSFVGTGLADWLRERDIDTLAVVGYMTQHCDDSTIRQAIHEGWQVEYLHDASGSVPYRNRAGQASADMALAQLWSQGRGIQPNRVNAYVFGQLAVQQQVPQASDLLGQIEAQLPPAERSQAQQLLKREQQSRGNNWQATVSLLQSQDSPINEEEPESL